MYNTNEMELISKLYSYMDENDKANWSREAAKDMYEDELNISAKNGHKCPIESSEVLFDTIAEFISQDNI